MKKHQDYGHQVIAVLLSCNGIILNYAFVLYDKTVSKIESVRKIAQELPSPPNRGYFLCDSWYPAKNLIESFTEKGFFTIGAVKTNRVIYPCGIKQQAKKFAGTLSKEDPNINLVTVGKRRFYVYRYDGKLNDFEHAVVILSYSENAFGNPGALRVFLSTDCRLTIQEILDTYAERWAIEVFFQQVKQKLAFGKCRLRSKLRIIRFWIVLSFSYFLCVVASGDLRSFRRGYSVLQQLAEKEYFLAYAANLPEAL